MKYKPSIEVSEELGKAGLHHVKHEVELDEIEFNTWLEKFAQWHPKESAEELYHRVGYFLTWKHHGNPETAKANIHELMEQRFDGVTKTGKRFIVALVLVVIWLLILTVRSFAQVDCVTVQQSGSNVGVSCAPLKLNFSGCTVSKSGTAYTITCTSGSVTNNPGGSANQLQFNSAGTAFGGIASAGLGKVLIDQGAGNLPAFADPLVQGTQAAGSTTLPSPVVSGGQDYSGTPTVRTWKVDSSGFGYVVFGAPQHVIIDSSASIAVTTTPPSNASTNVAQVAGTTTDTNSGVKSAGTLRVVLATDQPALTNKLLVTPDSVALPSHQSVNVDQANGTTLDTNSGVKSAGTIRVVLATDQPALTNKLLVTPDSVALPANQSVNISQINAVTPLMGNGTTGTGSQRVTIASDNTAFQIKITGNAGANLDAATGAAPPANAILHAGLGSGATGGFLVGVPVADTYKAINISTATTTLLITGVSGRQVRISALHLIAAGADNVALIEGTGATCGTGTAGMAGGTTAASGYNFAANGGLAFGSGFGTIMQTVTTGDSVCAVTSAAVVLAGGLQYTIY